MWTVVSLVFLVTFFVFSFTWMASFTLASSSLLAGPLRSRDRIDDYNMTAVDWGSYCCHHVIIAKPVTWPRRSSQTARQSECEVLESLPSKQKKILWKVTKNIYVSTRVQQQFSCCELLLRCPCHVVCFVPGLCVWPAVGVRLSDWEPLGGQCLWYARESNIFTRAPWIQQ